MGNEKIIEKELGYKINRCVFEVYRVLGHGFLEKVYDAQLLNYLKATKIQVGLLVNFTYPKATVKRFVF